MYRYTHTFHTREVVGAGGGIPADSEAADLDSLAKAIRPAAAAQGGGGAAREREKAKPKASAYSVLSMLQGRGPAKKPGAEERRWACGTCGCRNEGGRGFCSACEAPQGRAPAAVLPCRTPGPPDAAAVVALTEEDDPVERVEDDPVEQATAEKDPPSQHTFVVVKATGRLHVLDACERPLGVNFKLADWQASQDSDAFWEGQDPEATIYVCMHYSIHGYYIYI